MLALAANLQPSNTPTVNIYTCIHTPLLLVPDVNLCPAPVAISFCLPAIMDNLDSTFTIEINGSPICNLPGDVEEPVQAKVGSSSDAAVFTLKDGHLQCGDWILGRALAENRSMLPKQVLWFKLGDKERAQPVAAHADGSSYSLRFSGAPLIEKDGAVFADLLQEGETTVTVKLQ
ncbi:hypothetical protein BS50DRAFT_378688 [Corynespora cassiicola Philippines]|uniref:Ubiquitin 3 binding protein But2 C-terminal domain-containing protein n=1 Tax=Corynespora cassiicola Philippines TaxID=1448308 RepID=A0A2T2NNJ5_CORCC|nr:hypothetical protein BS50DRAFT_378688 [Corynespora cassiicola Philippines]